MNKADERLIKYLTGEMSSGEKRSFEEILKNSPELMDQKIRYDKLLQEMKAAPGIPVSDDYFTSIIPSFRKKLDAEGGRSRTFKWSLGLSSAAAVIVLMLIFLPPERSDNFQDVIVEMNNEEVLDLVEDMQIDMTPAETESEEKIEEMYIQELSAGDEIIISSELLNDNEILNSLSEEETELVYNQMINKDLLKD